MLEQTQSNDHTGATLPALQHMQTFHMPALQAWQRVCSTKKVHRYRPPSVQKALTALEVAREHHSAACEEAWRALQAVCGTHYVVLRRAVKALAQLDALLSMAHVAQQEGCV